MMLNEVKMPQPHIHPSVLDLLASLLIFQNFVAQKTRKYTQKIVTTTIDVYIKRDAKAKIEIINKLFEI